MKKNKGNSIIVLVVILVLLGIIATTIIYYAKGKIHKNELTDLKTDMLLIQAKLKGGLEQYNFEIQTSKEEDADSLKEKYLKGKKISDNKEIEDIFNNLDIEKNFDKYDYYYLDDETIKNLGLTDIKSNEKDGYFIVGYSTDRDVDDDVYETDIEVINTKGYEEKYSYEEIENIQ